MSVWMRSDFTNRYPLRGTVTVVMPQRLQKDFNRLDKIHKIKTENAGRNEQNSQKNVKKNSKNGFSGVIFAEISVKKGGKFHG